MVLLLMKKEYSLATYYADCVPLLIVDTKNKAIGFLIRLAWNCWKDWKSYNREDENFTVQKPKDIVACIGPSICQEML